MNYNNHLHLIFKPTDRRLVPSIVWTRDHNLLQKSNLTMQQPSKAPITSYVWL